MIFLNEKVFQITKLKLREVTCDRFRAAAISQSHRLCHLNLRQLSMKGSYGVPGFRPTSLNPKPTTIFKVYKNTPWVSYWYIIIIAFGRITLWVIQMNYRSFIYLLDLKEDCMWKQYIVLSMLAFWILEKKGQQVTANVAEWTSKKRRVWTDTERVG